MSWSLNIGKVAGSAVSVTDPTGKLVDLVTSETIAEMMMLREALPRGVRIGPWSRAAGA